MRLVLLSLEARLALVTVVFCILLARGWWTARLANRTILIFVALLAVGLIVPPYLSISQNAFVAWVAVLDVVLVFLVFRGDLAVFPRRR